MPLRLDIKKKLSNRSERVKAVDFHPTEPWLLAALYSGNIYVWNYETQNLVKTFEVTDLPIRAAKFIPRKNWVVAGSDDMHVRVFNYNTHEKVIAFEAHQDYIRSIAVHHTQPFLLTGSDDMTIKLWDWEKGWKNIMTFDGHTHYVMQVVFNPKDSNTFASASLDRTIKIWSLGSSHPNYTLEGHAKGVNAIDYYHGADKPYLISGADDKTVKVWDYQNKSCVQTLEGHTQNVTVVCFHPDLPILISGSEDGTVRIWHSSTYRLENTLNYGMERVWAMSYAKGTNELAFGYDEGTVSIKLGKEEPAISMENSGKVIYAKHNEIFTANVKCALGEESSLADLKDGERIPLSAKDLGNCEIFPQTLQHSPNGRFVVVCGDGEYIIYTALAWRNKSFGSALEFVWALDSNEYAIRESTSVVKLYKSFKEKNFVVRTNFLQEGLFGGTLLGIKSGVFVNFYDWETGMIVRRVDVCPREVYWSESDYVALICEDSLFILKFNRIAYQQAAETGFQGIDENGIEDTFEFISETPESVKTGIWIGDSFVFTNQTNRLNYLVDGQVSTIAHFDYNMYLLTYIPKDNRIFLCDKDMNVVSYAFPLSLIEYETAILRGDVDSARKLLPSLTVDQKNKVARFLESKDLKQEALDITTDSEHKFELAIQLERLDVAFEIAADSNVDEKWKLLGDLALKLWQFAIAEECMKRAKDFEGLLVFYQSSGQLKSIQALGYTAMEAGRNNVAFMCFLISGRLEACIELLVKTNRLPEATFFARTYLPSEVPRLVKFWKESLPPMTTQRQPQVLADPSISDQKPLFADYNYGLVAEEAFKRRRGGGIAPAAEYAEFKGSLEWDIIAELKQRFPNGAPNVIPSASDSPALASKSVLSPQVNGHHSQQHSNASSPRMMGHHQQPVTNTGTPAALASSPQQQQQHPSQNLPTSVPNIIAVQPVQEQKTSVPQLTNNISVTSASLNGMTLSNNHSPISEPLSVFPAKKTDDFVSSHNPVEDGSRLGLKEDRNAVDLVSDTLSHVSLEVNTTGTGSLKGDMDFDDTTSFMSESTSFSQLPSQNSSGLPLVTNAPVVPASMNQSPLTLQHQHEKQSLFSDGTIYVSQQQQPFLSQSVTSTGPVLVAEQESGPFSPSLLDGFDDPFGSTQQPLLNSSYQQQSSSQGYPTQSDDDLLL